MEKIVLMGHSTGSQDVIHYLSASSSSYALATGSDPTVSSGKGLPQVDGGILQAPASDREFNEDPTSPLSGLWLSRLPTATTLVKSARGAEILDEELCAKLGCRMSAYRLWSLTHVRFALSSQIRS